MLLTLRGRPEFVQRILRHARSAVENSFATRASSGFNATGGVEFTETWA
jgi:hypothetical protein